MWRHVCILCVVARSVSASVCDRPALEAQSGQAVEQITEGMLGQARPLLEHIASLAGQCPSPARETAVRAMLELAAIDRLTGKPADGLDWARKAAALAENLAPGDPVLLASALETLAQLEGASGKSYDAEPHIRRAIDIWSREKGDNSAQLASCYNTMAVLHLNLSDPEGARPHLERALELARASHTELTAVSVLHNMSHAARQLGNLEEAIRTMELAIAEAEQVLGADNPQLAPLLESYSKLLVRAKRRQEARKIDERARRLIARLTR